MSRSVDGIFQRALGPRELAGRLTNVGTVRLASLSPDGRRVAYVRADGARESLWVRNGDGTSHTQVLPPVEGNYRSVTFGPRDFVYYTLFLPDQTHISLYRVSAGGGTPELVNAATGRVSFSPDGLRYASVYTASLARSESRVVIDDMTGGATRVVATCQPPRSFLNQKPAWSADGRQLAVAAMDGIGKLELVVLDHEHWAARPALSPAAGADQRRDVAAGRHDRRRGARAHGDAPAAVAADVAVDGVAAADPRPERLRPCRRPAGRTRPCRSPR